MSMLKLAFLGQKHAAHQSALNPALWTQPELQLS